MIVVVVRWPRSDHRLGVVDSGSLKTYWLCELVGCVGSSGVERPIHRNRLLETRFWKLSRDTGIFPTEHIDVFCSEEYQLFLMSMCSVRIIDESRVIQELPVKSRPIRWHLVDPILPLQHLAVIVHPEQSVQSLDADCPDCRTYVTILLIKHAFSIKLFEGLLI